MALILLGLPEFGVGAMEAVQHAEHPEALVEPGTGTQGSTTVTMFDNNLDNSIE